MLKEGYNNLSVNRIKIILNLILLFLSEQYDLGILLQFKLIYAIDRQICKAGLNLKRILRLSDCITFIKSLYEHLFEFNSSHLLVLCESVNICPFCIVKEDPQA